MMKMVELRLKNCRNPILVPKCKNKPKGTGLLGWREVGGWEEWGGNIQGIHLNSKIQEGVYTAGGIEFELMDSGKEQGHAGRLGTIGIIGVSP